LFEAREIFLVVKVVADETVGETVRQLRFTLALDDAVASRSRRLAEQLGFQLPAGGSLDARDHLDRGRARRVFPRPTRRAGREGRQTDKNYADLGSPITTLDAGWGPVLLTEFRADLAALRRGAHGFANVPDRPEHASSSAQTSATRPWSRTGTSTSGASWRTPSSVTS
jgi:hypothetical protein